MEVATGLEPVKTGFAGQRLDRFGIATKMKGARLHAQFPRIVDELWGKFWSRALRQTDYAESYRLSLTFGIFQAGLLGLFSGLEGLR